MCLIKKIMLVIIFLNVIISITTAAYGNGESVRYEKVRAVIIEEKYEIDGEIRTQLIKAKLLGGKYEGGVVKFKHYLIDGSKYNIPLKEGMKVFLNLQLEGEEIQGVNFVDVVRDGYIKLLFVIFFMLLVILEDLKGFALF